MNLPDLTLVFQMIHFAIAYFVMKKLVFIPALNILNAQQLRKQRMEHENSLAQTKFQELRAFEQSRWVAIKKKLQASIPQFLYSCNIIKTHVHTEEIVSPDLTQQQQASVNQFLAKEISDIKS